MIPLGFILFLALVLLAIHIYSITFVPTVGHEEEIDANRDMRTQVLEFDFAVDYALATGQPQPVSVGSSVDYPMAFPSAPDPKYAIRTTENESITFENFQCIRGECESEFNTTTVVFLAKFNYFQEPQSYGYEYGVAYSAPDNETEGGDGTVAHSDQAIIDGNHLSMMRFHGNFTASGTNIVTTVIKPGSIRREEYTISGDGGDPIEITMPTELSESEWQSLIEDELTENGGNVTGFDYQNYTVEKEGGGTPGGGGPSGGGQSHWYDCDHPGNGRPFVECTRDNSTNSVTFTLDPDVEYTVTTYVMELSE